MDRIVKFIDLYWPVEICNLECEYCYIHQHRQNNKGSRYHCSHTPQEIRRALSVKRFGGICLLNLCAGGETFLEESIIPVLYELLAEGHYLNITTNGIVEKHIKKVQEFPKEFCERLLFKFSFHYQELKKRNKLEKFFEMVQFVQELGCSFSIELPAYDSFVPEQKEIIEVCQKKTDGICHVTALRDESKSEFEVLSQYKEEDFKHIWELFDSSLFRFRAKMMNRKIKEFCYAGDWSLCINLETGEVKQCYYERTLDNIYTNPEQKLTYCAVGNHCHSEHCYVCHAFLTLGIVPELGISFHYDEMRDRPEAGWLNPKMKQFMHQRLFDNNKKYNFFMKYLVNNENKNYEREQYIEPACYSNEIIKNMKSQSIKESYVLVEARHKVKIMYETMPEELKWIEHIYDSAKEGAFVGEEMIRIKALASSHAKAEGSEIWIVGMLVDDIWYDAEEVFEPKWLKRMRMIGWRSYDRDGISDVIEGQIPSGKKRILVLEKNKWRGICQVVYGDKDFEVDTYDEKEDALKYVEL